MQQNIPYQGMTVAPRQGAGNVPHGAIKDVVPNQVTEKLPESIQNIDAEQIANSNGAVSAIGGADPKTLRNSLAIYFPFIALRSINDMSKGPFNFAGEFDKTFLGKLAKIGDTISGAVSKIIPKSIPMGAKSAVKMTKDFAQKNSAIARSLSTPVVLESRNALETANGLLGRVLCDDANLFEKGFKGSVVNLFKNQGNNKFWNLLLSQNSNIESLPLEEANRVVSQTLQDLARRPGAEIQEYIDDLVNILSKSGEGASIDYPIIGKALAKLESGLSGVPGINKAVKGLRSFFRLDVPMSEMANKLKVSSGTAGATALGCALPSTFAKIYEGLTSDFVGGKVAPFLQAYFLMQAAARAQKAPKGQKLATFMDEEVGAVSFLLTAPVATSIMTKMGGMKYIGLSQGAKGATAAQLVQQQKQNVAKYREMIKILNEKVEGNLISRGEYLDEVKKIKDFLKGNTKFWQRPLKFIGKIVGSNYKAETIRPFLDSGVPENASAIKRLGIDASNMAQSFLYKLKTGTLKLPLIGSSPTPGGILRLILVMFVLSPLVAKPIRAVVNKIFGKPYDPVKEKEEAEKKAKEEALQNNPFNNMSDQELLTLLSKNQKALAELEKNPQLMQELQSDPQKLYDFLKQNAETYDRNLANAPSSPALQNYINQMNGNVAPVQPQVQPQPQAPIQPQMQPYPQMQGPYPYPQMQQPYYPYGQPMMPPQYIQPSQGYVQPNMTQTFNMQNPTGMNELNKNNSPKPNLQRNDSSETNNKQMVEPKRSYIPSSRPADLSAQMQAENQRINSILQDMDNTEKEFSKYLNI